MYDVVSTVLNGSDVGNSVEVICTVVDLVLSVIIVICVEAAIVSEGVVWIVVISGELVVTSDVVLVVGVDMV